MSRTTRDWVVERLIRNMTEKRKNKLPTGLFSVELEALNQGSIKMEREIPMNWLEGELAACEYGVKPLNATVNLKVEAPEEGILVMGDARAKVEFECGTCLATVKLNLVAPVNTYMLPVGKERQTEEGEDLTPEDLEREWYSGDTVLLDSLIRDAIMLELPMNPRCQDRCGGVYQSDPAKEDQILDPRLAPLANIKIQKEN